MQCLGIRYCFFAWKEIFKQRSNLIQKLSEVGRKTMFWLYSFSQYAYLSGCSDVINVGSDLVFRICKVKQMYVLMNI